MGKKLCYDKKKTNDKIQQTTTHYSTLGIQQDTAHLESSTLQHTWNLAHLESSKTQHTWNLAHYSTLGIQHTTAQKVQNQYYRNKTDKIS